MGTGPQTLMDDGPERTILLHPADQTLQLEGESESLKLRTVRLDVQTLNGSFTLIPKAHSKRILVRTFSAKSLQQHYSHLCQLPLKQTCTPLRG